VAAIDARGEEEVTGDSRTQGGNAVVTMMLPESRIAHNF
jgi:hypothetical protein